MIDFDFIERLIQVLDDSSIDSLEIERGGTRVRLSKSPPVAAAAVGMPAAMTVASAAPAPAPSVGAPGSQSEGEAPSPSSASSENLIDVTSPMVGTFYRASAPDAPSYVEEGKRVAVGDTLCIIEAMKLMNELESEVAGTIVEVCVENAQPVEFGQVLFRVEPS
jgi:acetyl-CoA carboxylase biotin carboxyl carrier protein